MRAQPTQTIVIPALPYLLRAVGGLILFFGIIATLVYLSNVSECFEGDCSGRNVDYATIVGLILAPTLFYGFMMFGLASIVEHLEGRSNSSGRLEKRP